MPKATKKSGCESTTQPPEGPAVLDSQEQSITSDQEKDEGVSFHPSLVYPAHPEPQIIPSMYMPNIEGPRMD